MLIRQPIYQWNHFPDSHGGAFNIDFFFFLFSSTCLLLSHLSVGQKRGYDHLDLYQGLTDGDRQSKDRRILA